MTGPQPLGLCGTKERECRGDRECKGDKKHSFDLANSPTQHFRCGVTKGSWCGVRVVRRLDGSGVSPPTGTESARAVRSIIAGTTAPNPTSSIVLWPI